MRTLPLTSNTGRAGLPSITLLISGTSSRRTGRQVNTLQRDTFAETLSDSCAARSRLSFFSQSTGNRRLHFGHGSCHDDSADHASLQAGLQVCFRSPWSGNPPCERSAAFFENEQGGYAADVVLLRDLRVLVHVHLVEADAVGILLGQFIHYRAIIWQGGTMWPEVTRAGFFDLSTTDRNWRRQSPLVCSYSPP